MLNHLKKLGQDCSGATAVEYGLILALIFLAAVGAIGFFGDSANSMWNNVSNTMSNAVKKA